MVKKLIPLILFTTAVLSAGAQQQGGTLMKNTAPLQTSQVGDINNMTVDDYMNMVLPPLGQLLENARMNPVVEYYDERRADELRELKTVKRGWLNYFKINAQYQYGKTNDLTSFNDDNAGQYNRYFGKNQNIYGVGASMSMPLFQIFNRRNMIKQQQHRIAQTEKEVNRWLDERNLLIVEAYTTAVQNLSLLKAMSEAVTISTAQYKVTEAEFINGKTDAQTLSRQKNILTQNISSYEQTKADLNNALLRLEILSKTPILKR